LENSQLVAGIVQILHAISLGIGQLEVLGCEGDPVGSSIISATDESYGIRVMSTLGHWSNRSSPDFDLVAGQNSKPLDAQVVLVHSNYLSARENLLQLSIINIIWVDQPILQNILDLGTHCRQIIGHN